MMEEINQSAGPTATVPASQRGGMLPDRRGSLRNPASILDFVNYQMYLIETFNSSKVTRICEGEFGITRREWRLISLLAAHGPSEPSGLAERAQLDRSRTSKAITLLATKRLIDRTGSDDSDRRRVRIALSDLGWSLYQRMFPRICAINSALLEPFSDDDLAQLQHLLDRLQARILELGRPVPSGAMADRRHGGSRRVWERDAAAGTVGR